MTEEQIEEIDWEGNVIAVHPKSRMKEKMFPHKVSLIIPRGKDNTFLFAKRAKDQFPFPNTWICAIGGKLLEGESYHDGALREAKEEADIVPEIEEISSFKYDKAHYQAIFYIYTTKDVYDISDMKGNPREVQYFKAFTLPEIAENVENEPESFAPTFRDAIKTFIENIKN